jgi:hypothetical protein
MAGGELPIKAGSDIEEMIARCIVRAEMDGELRKRVAGSLGAREFDKALDRDKLRLGRAYPITVPAANAVIVVDTENLDKWRRAYVTIMNHPQYNLGGDTFILVPENDIALPGLPLALNESITMPADPTYRLWAYGVAGGDDILVVHHGYGEIPEA